MGIIYAVDIHEWNGDTTYSEMVGDFLERKTFPNKKERDDFANEYNVEYADRIACNVDIEDPLDDIRKLVKEACDE